MGSGGLWGCYTGTSSSGMKNAYKEEECRSVSKREKGQVPDRALTNK